MTFFELIRKSLLEDSNEKRPSADLLKYVLSIWREHDQNRHKKDET